MLCIERISRNCTTVLLAALIPLLFISGCQSKSADAAKGKKIATSLPAVNDDYFQEIGVAAGIDFIHSIGSDHLTNIIESSGGGAAMLDYDKDGYMDLFVSSGKWIEGFSSGEKTANEPGNRLFRNLHNGTFADVTKEAKLDEMA